ncbi:aldo/keto reductase [Lentzea flaviverrucosa]|uniref:D-threo-aldose 1-dehydrogenase n=1 Tax=Lentzea flaviverrucosa TaxID=200379 RepID=A0A1H9X643_9PSEU|nr:aldo/keto reductase [Lentzea flaviverrucosa]RDI20786.1 D-threo-aldose 1-dehydrogenase [Lentzea flaviverrucosa]SES41610.1 D-threo-aldose 1-dehydrogenase [Lentzea flaviverrucosa]
MKVAVSRLGFGGAPIGNLYREVSDEVASGAVEAAWQNGVRYFDSAPHYGLGLSERRIGVALAGRPRDEYVISTKVGRLLEPFDGEGLDDEGFAVPRHFRRVRDYSADGVKRSIESSLERLGTDRVEIVYIHDPDDHWDAAFGEAYPALEELRSQGVVGAIGVGMNQWEMPERFVRETDIDVVMLAGRYTLLEQPSLVSFLPACVERGVSVVACGVFNSGLLSKPVVAADAKYNYEEAPSALVERARAIAGVCGRHGVTLPEAAIQFALGHPAVVSVVVGARTAEQMTANAAYFSASVPEDLWNELKTLNLIDPEVPTP